VRAQQVIDYTLEGIDYAHIEPRIVEGTNVVDTVLRESVGYDLIVLGATNEPLFENLLLGGIAEQIAKRADITVIMVKRRSTQLHSFLRQTVLEPTTGQKVAHLTSSE
jgi:nucleotide-binding universal stress UspA family protein